MKTTTHCRSGRDSDLSRLLRLPFLAASLPGLLFAFLLGLSPAGQAANTTGRIIELTGDQASLHLGQYLELYSDPQGQYGPDNLPPAELFTPSTADIPSLGYSKETHWARFSLHNGTDRILQLTLRQRYALIDDLTVTRIHGDGSVSTLRTGDGHPFSQRPIPQASFLFPQTITPGETTTYYLSYRSGGQVNIDLWLLNSAGLISGLETENLLKGAYYGGMLALILYNLFLFISIRDTNYLRYVVYTSCYALLQVSYNGVAFEYLWPDNPWWTNVSLNMIVCLAVLTMMNFARHFLETAHYQPILNKTGRGLEFIALGFVLASPLLPYRVISLSGLILALISVTLILTMSIVSLRAGFKPARYFLAAWLTLMVGVVAAVLKAFGILPQNFFTEYGFQIGSYLEITLLSIALADRMARLQEASITDSLTKTYNRRHFDASFQKAFDQVKNRRATLSLAILDIDHFKQFNDRYGHEAGDEALATVARTLKCALRDTDTLFRYGGEEFTALLPNTSPEGAMLVAERMRKTVGELKFKGQNITISIGLTTFDGSNYASPPEMLGSADKALYRAKRQGRNRCEHARDLDSGLDGASVLLD